MHRVMLVIEPKDGITAAGVSPAVPGLGDLCEQLTELLAKATDRHALLGYRVTEVTTE